MRKIIFTFLALVILALPTIVIAADFRANESGDINVGKDESVKNLYLAGNNVNSNAFVNGDLAIGGSNLTVSGNIANSLFAAGANINIKGDVAKSARLAGGTVLYDAKVGEDLFIGGGTITISENSDIGGDLIVAGGNITLDNKIGGKVWASGGKIIINGEINGNVVAKNVNTLEIGEKAIIRGNLDYYSPNQATISSSAQILGKTNLSQVKSKSVQKWGDILTLMFVYKILTAFIIGLILIFALPKLAAKTNSETFSKFWSNLGWGLIALIVTPIIALVLMVSVVGIKIAVIIGLVYTIILIMTSIFIPLSAGSLVYKLINRQKEYRLDWQTVLIGSIVALIVGLIPVIGWVAIFILFLSILGTLTQSFWASIKSLGK